MPAMNWPVVFPELWLLLAACGVLLADLFSTDPQRRLTFWLTQASIAVFAAIHSLMKTVTGGADGSFVPRGVGK